MLDLLKWRAHPERINDSLSKLKEIDGSEIVKVSNDIYSQHGLVFLLCLGCSVSFLSFSQPQFLQDTLDTLFGILDESSQRYGLKVFDSLVSQMFKPCSFYFIFICPFPLNVKDKLTMLLPENRNNADRWRKSW